MEDFIAITLISVILFFNMLAKNLSSPFERVLALVGVYIFIFILMGCLIIWGHTKG